MQGQRRKAAPARAGYRTRRKCTMGRPQASGSGSYSTTMAGRHVGQAHLRCPAAAAD